MNAHSNSHTWLKNTAISAVLFFIVTMPFRHFFRVIEITEMRPAAALPPVLGLMLGIPGALGCAIGNFIADLLSGYGLAVSLVGFPVQFIYGILPWLVWRRIRSGAHSEFFRLNNFTNVLKYLVIMAANSVLMAGMLGVVFAWFGFSPIISYATLMVLYNNLVFSIVLGIPIVIFIAYRNKKSRERGLSLNERLALVFLMTAIVVSITVWVFAYRELRQDVTDPLAMWIYIYGYVAVTMVVMFSFALGALFYAEKKITMPLQRIATTALRYTDGTQLDSERAIAECNSVSKIHNEAGILARAFKKMILDLDAYIENLQTVTAEKERIGAELDVATKIQASMLPCIFPPFPNLAEFDIYAKMEPAKEVGGDFYDFFLINPTTLAVVMADVSGNGVPAALFMVITKTLIKNNVLAGKSPKEVFETVNNMLCENNEADMFVTAILGYLDVKTGKFTFVNAGHNPPLHCGNGDVNLLKTKPGLVLAGMENISYQEHVITLAPGDGLFLYTDGITEAANVEEQLFGNARLLDAINNSKDLPIQEITTAIKAEIDRFAGNAEQADDIAMLILQYRGRAGKLAINHPSKLPIKPPKRPSDKRTHIQSDRDSGLTLDATLSNLPKVHDYVNAQIVICPEKTRNKISLAIDEIFSNIATHAYAPKTGKVTISVTSSKTEAAIKFRDSGKPFNPEDAPLPDLTNDLETREIGGLGIFMAKKVMDAVEYLRDGNENVLVIRKSFG